MKFIRFILLYVLCTLLVTQCGEAPLEMMDLSMGPSSSLDESQNDDGSCAYVEDCAGVCNGASALDDCGVCDGGNASMDCAGECNGNATEDCAGVCGGSAFEDSCGYCIQYDWEDCGYGDGYYP